MGGGSPVALPVLLLLPLAALAAGALMLVSGLRGKRINDHPVCARCRYDLSGLNPAPDKCPECARTLGGPRAIRLGERRRRRGLAAAGGFLLVIGLAAAGAGVWGWAAKFDWNTIKPLGLLLYEADSPSPSVSGPAAAELARRITAGTFSGERVGAGVERGLTYQADPNRAWAQGWGDFLDAARTAGLMTDEQFDRYLANGVVASVRIRPRVRAGDPAEIHSVVAAARLGGATYYFGFKVASGALVPASGAAPEDLHLSNYGGVVGLNGMGGSGWATELRVITAPPGKYILRLTGVLDADAGPMGAHVVRACTAEAPVEVLPADTPGVRAVRDESLRPAVEKALRVHIIQAVPGGPGTTTLSFSYTLAHLPVGVAFHVRMRDADNPGGETWALPDLVSPPIPGQHAFGNSAPDLRGFDARRVDLIFEPDAAIAQRTVDVLEYWDAPLEIKGLEVHRPPPVQLPPPPAPPGNP